MMARGTSPLAFLIIWRKQNLNYVRQVGESEEEYIFRVCQAKPLIGSWPEVADILNKELGYEYTESKYRKQYSAYVRMFEKVGTKHLDDAYVQSLDEKKEELYKQEIKARDRTRELKNELRFEARYENLVQAVKDAANSLPEIQFNKNVLYSSGGNEAVLNISDWHTGNTVNNFKNKFNYDILVKRIEKVKNDTIRYCKVNNVRKLNVLNLGDLVAGFIHIGNRIENEFDVVTQTMKCAELLSNLLSSLAEEIDEVVYRSVAGNHERCNRRYDEHIDKENFGRIIDWYLETRLANTDVVLQFDNIDDSIGYFQTEQGKNVFFVHGHLDNVNQILQNLSFGTDMLADYVFVAHWHTAKMKEFGCRKVYVNGSGEGVDEFALNHRFFSKPSQLLVVFDGENEIDCRINL